MKGFFFLTLFVVLNIHIVLAQNQLYVNSGNGVNLREGPGTNHKTLHTIPQGTRLQVVSREGEWIKVKYDGKTGYVSNQYLSEDKPRSASNNQKKSNVKTSGSSKAKNSSGGGSSSSAIAEMPKWGIGLRMGDPFGLTVKRYLARNHAIEFNLGSTSYWGYDHRNYFNRDDRYTGYDYLGYSRRGAVALQVHYLFQKPFPSAPNLHWYWGVGGQFRSKAYQYNYRQRAYYGPGQGDYVWVRGSDRVSDIDFGADLVLGLEYHLPKAPISFFADTNLLTELFDDPFTLYLQGGIGIRFNIR